MSLASLDGWLETEPILQRRRNSDTAYFRRIVNKGLSEGHKLLVLNRIT